MFADQQDVVAIARLYEAGLDRAALRPGLNFWVDSFERGESLAQIAGRFLVSPEFTVNYGPIETLDNREYVERLFLNVLDRPGLESGIRFWVSELQRGVKSRADLLVDFATGRENTLNTPELEQLTLVGNGEWWFPGGLPGGDIPGNATSGATLGVGQARDSALFGPQDIDFFNVFLEAGRTYRFTVEPGPNLDAGIFLYPDEFGEPVNPVDIFDFRDVFALEDFNFEGGIESVAYRPQFDENIWVGVGGFGAGPYRLRAQEIGRGDDAPGNVDTQYHVKPFDGFWTNEEFGGPATVGPDDPEDWYGIVLEQGERVRIELFAALGNGRPANDPDLDILDFDGRLVRRLDEPGDESAIFEAPAGGEYFLAVYDFDPRPQGEYFLDVTEL